MGRSWSSPTSSRDKDGDIFPAVIQMEKLAPVIGMRSWAAWAGIFGDRNSWMAAW